MSVRPGVVVLLCAVLAAAIDPEPSLCDLPDEVLGMIVNRIWDQTTLASLSLVNHKLYEITALPLRVMPLADNGPEGLQNFIDWVPRQSFLLQFPDLPKEFPEEIIDRFKRFADGDYDEILPAIEAQLRSRADVVAEPEHADDDGVDDEADSDIDNASNEGDNDGVAADIEIDSANGDDDEQDADADNVSNEGDNEEVAADFEIDFANGDVDEDDAATENASTEGDNVENSLDVDNDPMMAKLTKRLSILKIVQFVQKIKAMPLIQTSMELSGHLLILKTIHFMMDMTRNPLPIKVTQFLMNLNRGPLKWVLKLMQSMPIRKLTRKLLWFMKMVYVDKIAAIPLKTLIIPWLLSMKVARTQRQSSVTALNAGDHSADAAGQVSADPSALQQLVAPEQVVDLIRCLYPRRELPPALLHSQLLPVMLLDPSILSNRWVLQTLRRYGLPVNLSLYLKRLPPPDDILDTFQLWMTAETAFFDLKHMLEIGSRPRVLALLGLDQIQRRIRKHPAQFVAFVGGTVREHHRVILDAIAPPILSEIVRVRCSESGQTLLHYAVQSACPCALSALLAVSGLDVTVPNSQGVMVFGLTEFQLLLRTTPTLSRAFILLFLAMVADSVAAFRSFVELPNAAVVFNAFDMTFKQNLLHWAFRLGRDEIALLLLRIPVPEYRSMYDIRGRNPMYYVNEHQGKMIAAALAVQAHANPGQIVAVIGAAIGANNVSFVRKLLDQPYVDSIINERCPRGYTLLHYSFQHARYRISSLLYRDPNLRWDVKDSDDKLAVNYAESKRFLILAFALHAVLFPRSAWAMLSFRWSWERS